MTDSGDEFFFNNVIIYSSSSDSETDDESDVLVATAVVNHHIACQRPLFRGSLPGLPRPWTGTEMVGMPGCTGTTSIQPIRCSRRSYSGAVSG